MSHASIEAMAPEQYPETIPVPATVKFPIELEPPPGFRVDEAESWPRVEGRLEYVGGRLLYMPPCGDTQQRVSFSLVGILHEWIREHREFIGGGNEAGMLFEGEVRGAEGALWPRAALPAPTGRYVRLPPLLAAEVAGRDEGEPELRKKARWYLDRGVQVVWILLPARRDVVVIGRDSESRHQSGERLPSHPALPGLAPLVDEFFEQLDPL